MILNKTVENIQNVLIVIIVRSATIDTRIKIVRCVLMT